MVRIDSNWQYHGLRAVVLENRTLKIVVLPETGGRIYSIIYKPDDYEFLWHHPRIQPRQVPFGSSFDDTMIGGWDEMFPTVEACTFRGESLPDHGELWALPWNWQVIADENGSDCLYTSVCTPITPIRFERWVTLSDDRPEARIRYRITNLATNALDLIWGIHPMFNITEHHRLDLPGGSMLVETASAKEMGSAGQQYDWPFLPVANGSVDMRVIPAAEAAVSAGHYATAPSQPWFALTDQKQKIGIAMVYPPDIFRALWLWMCYGGWRGLYHLAVEPWTGYPVRLDQAVSAGRQYILQAGQSVTYEVAVVIYTGLIQAARIEQEETRYTVYST